MLMHLLLRGYLFIATGTSPRVAAGASGLLINYGLIPAAGLAVSQRPRTG